MCVFLHIHSTIYGLLTKFVSCQDGKLVSKKINSGGLIMSGSQTGKYVPLMLHESSWLALDY